MAKKNNIWKINNVETEFDALYKAKEYCKRTRSEYVEVGGTEIKHYTDGVLINTVKVSVDCTGTFISFSRPVKA